MAFEDRFSNGVWYDHSNGEYNRMSYKDGEVRYHDPFSNEIVDSIPEDDFVAADYTRVDKQAVQYPEGYFDQTLDELIHIAREGGQLEVQQDISFMFARQQLSFSKEK